MPALTQNIPDVARLRSAFETATQQLLAEQNQSGFWEGELSSSALSTATAVTTLALALKNGATNDTARFESAIGAGLRWLAQNQNSDGGWGDTTRSLSNISTTTLVWAAFGAAAADQHFSATVRRAEQWLGAKKGSLNPDAIARAIIARYGKDRTFSVPILTMCALAGRLGSGRDAWRHVIPLPFELAALPHGFFAALRLPVVSYALPALIAIGQVHHAHAPTRNLLVRGIRNATRARTLRVLTAIQPANGGFLEATPLTSFVTMSLLASGLPSHNATQRGLEFLRQSQRSDGSWPIDTNLSTWCTTLAIEALPASQAPSRGLTWLLQQQHRAEHPYTHAAPGGWAWTDLPGGVPDADDTSGALLALAKLRTCSPAQRGEIDRAATAGICWLTDLQNRDGGIPTFCRGWGALPFDRSSADITAHAVRAWIAWRAEVAGDLRARIDRAIAAALKFLQASQRPDGSWVPLWFGNEHAPDDENPTYGTARVLCALSRAIEHAESTVPGETSALLASEEQAVAWLTSIQRQEGSWAAGARGESSIEETALAVEALATVAARARAPSRLAVNARTAAWRGAAWLVTRVESGEWRQPAPIGFYFAKLWYFERLYPMIFTVGALRAVSALCESD